MAGRPGLVRRLARADALPRGGRSCAAAVAAARSLPSPVGRGARCDAGGLPRDGPPRVCRHPAGGLSDPRREGAVQRRPRVCGPTLLLQTGRRARRPPSDRHRGLHLAPGFGSAPLGTRRREAGRWTLEVGEPPSGASAAGRVSAGTSSGGSVGGGRGALRAQAGQALRDRLRAAPRATRRRGTARRQLDPPERRLGRGPFAHLDPDRGARTTGRRRRGGRPRATGDLGVGRPTGAVGAG